MMTDKNKIPVGILGATGSVGQKFIELLADHPWFEIKELAASEASAGKSYKDAVNWSLRKPMPEAVSNIIVKKCEPDLNSKIVFSGLDSSIAGEVEEEFAKNGCKVISNSKNHRMDESVPLLIPEVNPNHIELVNFQHYGNGFVVTNPNCSVIGLCIALKPLMDNYEIEQINVVTMQATSGAGNLNRAQMNIDDNVIPYIQGEEEKVETEPLKIFGRLNGDNIEYKNIKISAQCNRVNVTDGHLESIQIKFDKTPEIEEIKNLWNNFTSLPQQLKLPFAPDNPIYYFDQVNFPQPKIHRDIENGMAVSVGRLRPDKLFDIRFGVLSHNTARGAAGGAILCAELLKAKGYL